jgi:hypothetical protein
MPTEVTEHEVATARADEPNAQAIREEKPKTSWFVNLDAAVKIVVAMAVAVISFATYRLQTAANDFQQQTETARQKAVALANDEQRYLPLFRSITEVDAALVEISTEFGWPLYTHQEADQENRLGTRLAYLADSMYFPHDDFGDGKPKILLLTAVDNASGVKNGTTVSMRADDAVRLLSELMRIEPMLKRMSERAGLNARVVDGSLTFEDRRHVIVDEIPLANRAVAPFELCCRTRECLHASYIVTSISRPWRTRSIASL